MKNKVFSIVVTFNPDHFMLKNVLLSLKNQVEMIIIINNDKRPILLNIPVQNIHVIELGKNFGIAYAQNVGISQAKKLGCKFLLLSDQDTIYPSSYVSDMIHFYHLLSEISIFCLVPSILNETRQKLERIATTKFRTNDINKIKNNSFIVEHAISSGSFIPIENIEKVGYLNEKLFIDYVDFEWCWRARQKGLQTVAIKNIIIHHKLGESTKQLAGKKYTLRSGIRYYYMIRNGVYLTFFSDLLKFYERILFLKRMFVFSFGILIFCNLKGENLSYIIKAWKDAIIKKMGKFN